METKERIISKARDLFFRYGFKSVSMDDIAAGAGISKKTIYQFFTDKDALVDDVVEIEIKHNEMCCVQQEHQSENAIHEVFLSLEQMNEILSMTNPLLIYELEKYHSATHEKFISHKNKFFVEIVKNNLQRGIKEGIYKPDLNIDILSKFRISSSFLVFNADIFPHRKYSLTQVMQEITENFLYGMATPLGQQLILKYKSKKN
jgi:TetR/AcrR family transcriptional regulator, cholesterol catabolism regulator